MRSRLVPRRISRNAHAKQVRLAFRHHPSIPQRKNLVLPCILFCALLSACIPRHGTPAVPLTRITFACPRSDFNLYQAAAATFHEANPSIQVHVIPLDDSIAVPATSQADALAPLRRLASQADTFFWSAAAVEGGPPGLLLDLTTFVEATGQPAEADFLPGLLAHFQWQGHIWGLPAGVDPLLVLYDRAAFAAAGLEPPAPGWTWDALFDAARQLTQQEGGQVVRYGFADPGLGSVRPVVEALGGPVGGRGGGPAVAHAGRPSHRGGSANLRRPGTDRESDTQPGGDGAGGRLRPGAGGAGCNERHPGPLLGRRGA